MSRTHPFLSVSCRGETTFENALVCGHILALIARQSDGNLSHYQPAAIQTTPLRNPTVILETENPAGSQVTAKVPG